MFTAKRLRPIAQGCGSYPGNITHRSFYREVVASRLIAENQTRVLLTQPRWGNAVGRALSQTRYATLGYEPQPLRGKDQLCV
jgi:hypothetical protein